MKRPAALPASLRRVFIFVDESNVTSSARVSNRRLDWIKLRDFLVGECALLEMVVYAGLPPAMTEWQAERDRKNKFLHWLRAHGILVVTKEGAPADEAHYKANVDVLLAIDAVELSTAMVPEARPPSNLLDCQRPPGDLRSAMSLRSIPASASVVVLVTGDADFAPLALQLRRRGIRVEAASLAQTLGAGLKTSVNEAIVLRGSGGDGSGRRVGEHRPCG